jgi:tRNA pseudouridine55 synthase
MNYDGFYLIDKPKDWTSFDVCARMRKILNTKKIGHTGTLDPFATGLLVVAVGKCTRLIPFLEKAKKTYITKIILGQTSETLDSESEIVKCEYSSEPTLEQIEEVLKTHSQGKIEQIPPKYSAIKMGGQKACDMARRGEDVEMKSRQTEIISTKILRYNFPEIEIELKVSAGFYVRSFARDLGEHLAGGGMCQELRRTKIEDISVEDADMVETISGPIDPQYILTNISHREIPTGRVQDFIAGRAFPFSGIEKEPLLVLVGNKTIGMGEVICGNLQPRVVL